MEEKIPGLLKKYQEQSLWTDFHQEEYLLQPLSEYHLENKVNDDIGLKGNPQQLKIYSIVGVLVLLLGCINYMNLAIARSINRAKEVGLRKVVGAARGQLIGQFLTESMVLALVSFVVALILLTFLLPVFSELVERSIDNNLLLKQTILPMLLILILIVGIISGSYPAFFMSVLRPVEALKNKIEKRQTSFNFQRLLIIGQYVVSIVMIIGSLVIYLQFRYIQHKEIGYDKEHIVTIRIEDFPSSDKYQVLKNELLTQPGILAVTASTELPTHVTSNTVINYEGNENDDPLVIYRVSTDNNFLDVYGIKMIAGQDPSKDPIANLKGTLLINESACKALAWKPDEAIGQNIKNRGTIVGVVKDFHMLPMHYAIEPLMLQMNNQAWLEYISVKIRPEEIQNTIAQVKKTVSQFSNFPFDYQFLDDQFDRLYKSDLQTGKTLRIFTILSILIASMGLYGLAALSASQRIKEIGIRKVLGATINSLITLLSSEFLKMVLVGYVLAIPLAWLLAKWWLSDYAYSIQVNWWMFALPGLGIIILALLTTSSHTINAARNNPVDCLRSE